MPLTADGLMKPPEPTPDDDDEPAFVVEHGGFFVPEGGPDGNRSTSAGSHRGPGSSHRGRQPETMGQVDPHIDLNYAYRVCIHEVTGFEDLLFGHPQFCCWIQLEHGDFSTRTSMKTMRETTTWNQLFSFEEQEGSPLILSIFESRVPSGQNILIASRMVHYLTFRRLSELSAEWLRMVPPGYDQEDKRCRCAHLRLDVHRFPTASPPSSASVVASARSTRKSAQRAHHTDDEAQLHSRSDDQPSAPARQADEDGLDLYTEPGMYTCALPLEMCVPPAPNYATVSAPTRSQPLPCPLWRDPDAEGSVLTITM